ncbi:hypothetical protein [Chlorogloeopsis sp. ULAP02]
MPANTPQLLPFAFRLAGLAFGVRLNRCDQFESGRAWERFCGEA